MIEQKEYMGIWDAIKLILISLFIEISMSIVITAILYNFNIVTDNPFLQIIPGFGGLILILKIANDKYEINIMDNFSNKKDLQFIIPMLITIVGLNIFLSEILNYIEAYFPMSDFWVEIFENAFGEKANYIGILFTTIILAPITEEVLLRGVILKGLLSKYSSITAILVSSVIFGVIHGNVYQFVLAIVIGIFFGWMFVKTRSLLLCILAHAFFNALNFISADLLKLQIPGYTVEGFQPLWFTLVGVTLTFIGLAFLMAKTSDMVPMSSKTYGES